MSKLLRIGFVSVSDASDVTSWSGIPAHVLDALRRQAQVELISPLSQSIKYALAPAKALAKWGKASISLDHYPLVLDSYARQINRTLRERPVDVVFATSSIPVAHLDCPQPILFWTDAVVHGMMDYYPGSFSNMPASARLRAQRQEEQALARCAFAGYASNWAAETARQLTDPAKIAVLPFGASFTVSHTIDDVRQWSERKRRERPRSCKLLFTGVDWVRKGAAIAVETARILNESGIATTLKIVGCQAPGAVPEYVEVLGFISKSTAEGRQRLASLFEEADFFILPTQAEAAGIVFCEASAYGLPPLSFATGGVPDYVRNGVNGVCLPLGSEAAAFAQAIRRLLDDPAEYRRLCLGAFHEYESRLNWDASVAKLVELCRRAVDARH